MLRTRVSAAAAVAVEQETETVLANVRRARALALVHPPRILLYTMKDKRLLSLHELYEESSFILLDFMTRRICLTTQRMLRYQ